MMIISTRGRYALRILIDLAEHQNDAYVTLRQIAERQRLSEKYLESIVKELVRGKYIEGLRGKGGRVLPEHRQRDAELLTEIYAERFVFRGGFPQSVIDVDGTESQVFLFPKLV